MRRTLNTGKKKKRTASAPMEAALNYLERTARTKREMERYLEDDKMFDEVSVMETIRRLEELNLINDEAFAMNFVETRLNTKPISRMHLRHQLEAHELSAETIEAALETIDDETERKNAYDVAQKFNRTLSSLDDEERRDRVFKRLATRGYSFELAREAVEAAMCGEDEDA